MREVRRSETNGCTRTAGDPGTVVAGLGGESHTSTPFANGASRPSVGLKEPSVVALEMTSPLTAIVLAGGRGTRLQGRHPDLPKPLISCAGHPFLEWSLAALRQLGISDFVVSTGYLAERFEEYLRRRPDDGATIRLVPETSPLGTGGAIRFAWQTCPGRDVLVVNGDSLLMADLTPAFSQFEPAAARKECQQVVEDGDAGGDVRRTGSRCDAGTHEARA